MMITVTRLNGSRVTVNALLIESVEETPDTIITLTTGKKLVVTETAAEIETLVRNFFAGIGLVRSSVLLQQQEGL